MTLNDIIEASNVFTDEQLDEEDLLNIANTGISRINNEVGTSFPLFSDTSTDYTAIPKYWLNNLIGFYLSYGIKMNDSSLNEANIYLDEFYRLLQLFKERLASLVELYENGDEINGISGEYVILEGIGGVFGIETSNAINVGFFGYRGNGGCY